MPEIEPLLHSETFLRSRHEDKVKWISEVLKVTPDQITQTAHATIGQRENLLWGALRKRRLTASKFGELLAAINRKR